MRILGFLHHLTWQTVNNQVQVGRTAGICLNSELDFSHLNVFLPMSKHFQLFSLSHMSGDGTAGSKQTDYLPDQGIR